MVVPEPIPLVVCSMVVVVARDVVVVVSPLPLDSVVVTGLEVVVITGLEVVVIMGVVVVIVVPVVLTVVVPVVRKSIGGYGNYLLDLFRFSGIHGMQATKHTSEGSTLALKPRGDIIRSPKQGYQWPHKEDSCPPKIKKKIIQIMSVSYRINNDYPRQRVKYTH